MQGEFVRFGKRDVPYRDLPIHGKRITLWVVRRRYTCRACKTTFRPQLPEMVDGFRMTLRLHEYVEKESFNHPYTFVAAQTGLDEKTVRDIFNARAEFLGRWHRFETPRILGIDELPEQVLSLHPDQHQGKNPARPAGHPPSGRSDQLPDEAEGSAEGRDRQHGHVEPLPQRSMLYTSEHKKKAPDCEGLSVLQENHRLRNAGLSRGTQQRGRSINHLRLVSGWWSEDAQSTIKSVYPFNQIH